MKSVKFFLGFAICLMASTAFSQNIYMKFVQYSSGSTGGGTGGSSAGSDGSIATAGMGPATTATDGSTTVQLKDYLQVSGFQFDQEQTINFSSQSSGAGAGKIAFNPLTIVKSVDDLSPKLFQSMAQGTPFRRIEVLFVKPATSSVYYKVILKLVAVKSQAVSSVADCTEGCVAESVSFEYGGMQIVTYKQSGGAYTPNPLAGWDRILNKADQ